MHSCSDKGGWGLGFSGGESRRITWSDSSLSQRRQRHAAVWPQETGRRGGGGSLILIPGYCGACGERSLGDRDGGGRVGGGASSSAGRKEEFPPASDCLTCKKVPFVATTSLLFFLPPLGSLSATSCLLFLPFFSLPPRRHPPHSVCSFRLLRGVRPPRPSSSGFLAAAATDWSKAPRLRARHVFPR